MKLKVIFKGGRGSGNFGHSGRPGKVGGSAGKVGGFPSSKKVESAARKHEETVISALGVDRSGVEEVTADYHSDNLWHVSMRVLAEYDESKPDDDMYADRIYNAIMRSLKKAGYKKVGEDGQSTTFQKGKRGGDGPEITIDDYTSGTGGGAREAFDVSAWIYQEFQELV